MSSFIQPSVVDMISKNDIKRHLKEYFVEEYKFERVDYDREFIVIGYELE